MGLFMGGVVLQLRRSFIGFAHNIPLPQGHPKGLPKAGAGGSGNVHNGHIV